MIALCELCEKARATGKVVTRGGGFHVCGECMLKALDREDICTIGEWERMAKLTTKEAN